MSCSPRKNQRVGVRAMAVVAHQRARAPLRMVELGARKAVVDEQQHACRQPLGHGTHPGLGAKIDFRGVARRQTEEADALLDGGIGRTFAPGKLAVLPADLHLLQAGGGHAEALHRHGVEQFVAEHDTAEVFVRQGVEPVHAPQQVRCLLFQCFRLARAQFGAQLQDEIAPRPSRGSPAQAADRRPGRRCRHRPRGYRLRRPPPALGGRTVPGIARTAIPVPVP